MDLTEEQWNLVKIMAIAERTGLPVALCTASASPAEVTLTRLTVESRITDAMPQRLIGDKAYDSDGLDRHLEAVYGIEMIAPNRKRAPSRSQGPRRPSAAPVPSPVED